MQRVARAEVRVAEECVGRIGAGLLLLVGSERGDDDVVTRRVAERCARLRIFPDAEGRMNLSVLDTGGEVLVVSQFTLAGDTRRGRRPSFDGAAPPDEARPRIELFRATLEGLGLRCASGRFGAHMEVELVNDGPVTFVVDERAAR